MILTTEEMMLFKRDYISRMTHKAVKVMLTPYEAQNQDFWADKLFGSAEYSFMFDVLIPNSNYAQEYGYEIAV